MLLDVSQAVPTVNIFLLQCKIHPFKGRLFKLQHFIILLFQARRMHVVTGMVSPYLYSQTVCL